jgi:hypothetical protein
MAKMSLDVRNNPSPGERGEEMSQIDESITNSLLSIYQGRGHNYEADIR